ncbi:MAG: cytochrome C [Ignavibacteria bacterium]|nr:MAG: cytochrome C [Ignavibacteria bacterium]
MKKIIFTLCFLPAIIFAQISPGDLSEFHKDLEGLSNCTKCHVLGEKVTNAKCLDCHEKVQNLIDMNRGFHANSETKKKECKSCHPEHFGRDFNLIKFDKDKFDHSQTGYVLEGKHADTKCEECHKREFISDKDLKKKKGTFLGLERDCKSCHTDYHQGTLSDDCASCHNTQSFRPAPKFDHNNAQFKLTGKHIDTDCLKCHKKTSRNNKEFQQFKNLKFASCENCHKDPHRGNFGKNCEGCHTTESFHIIRNQKNFNHDKTKFPLKGKHQSVKCADCHGNAFQKKPKFALCIDCHEDYHKGEISKVNGKMQDCSVCHTVNGFTESKFGIGEHLQIDFKLEGSHLAVPCINCHYKNEKWKFDFATTRCAECHENIHEKFISAKFTQDGCEKCHSVESWEKTKEFDHSETKFELIGKHKNVKCGDCHFDRTHEPFIQKFKNMNSECEACHKDVHYSQFAVSGKTDCNSCHTPENWGANKFDHEKTRFSLTGAHSKVQCFECHKVVQEKTKRYVKFKIEDIRCASCHTS